MAFRKGVPAIGIHLATYAAKRISCRVVCTDHAKNGTPTDNLRVRRSMNTESVFAKKNFPRMGPLLRISGLLRKTGTLNHWNCPGGYIIKVGQNRPLVRTECIPGEEVRQDDDFQRAITHRTQVTLLYLVGSRSGAHTGTLRSVRRKD